MHNAAASPGPAIIGQSIDANVVNGAATHKLARYKATSRLETILKQTRLQSDLINRNAGE